MIRLIVYLGLALFGLTATILSPFAGAIACLEAYLLNPAVILGDTVDFRFQLWLTLAFVGSILWHRPAGSRPVRQELRVIVFLWFFLAIGTASAAWAEVSSQQSLEGINELFKTILIVSLLIKVIQHERQMSAVVTACLIGTLHAAIAHTLGVRWGYVPQTFGKAQGVLPDGQTPVMVLFFPLVVVTALLGSRWQKVFAWVTIPVALDSIVISYMRAGFVSLIVEGLALILLLPRRLVVRTVPMVLVVTCLFAYRLTPDDYWQRMGTIRNPHEEASAESRLVIADASMRMLIDHPFGVGYANYGIVSPRYLPPVYLSDGRRTAHSSFFSIACETGVAGFAVWMSAFGGAVFLLRRVRKSLDDGSGSPLPIYALGLEVGLYGWMAGGMFHGDHEVDPAYWFVAFAVVLTRLHRGGDHQDDTAKEASDASEWVAIAR